MKTRYTKRKDRDGVSKQIVIGYKPNGKKDIKTLYGKNDDEIDEQLYEIKHQIKKGIYVSEKITLEEWSLEWLELYKKPKERNTYNMYKSMVVTHINPALGRYNLLDLKTHHLQKLVNSFLERGEQRAAEICKITLTQIFKQAMFNDYVFKNVASAIELPTKKKTKKRALTESEKAFVLNANYSDIEKAYLYLLYYTGMRRGEALAVSRNDFDFTNNVINVRRNIVYKGNTGSMNNYLKTSSSNREVPLLPQLKEVILPYIEKLPSIYLFEWDGCFPLKMHHFKKLWKNIFTSINEKAGGNEKILAINKDITPHMFRHNFATILYYAGVDIKSAQRIMGHSTINILLDIYTHLDGQNDKVSYDKLNLFLSGGQSTDSQTRYKNR